jgi:uncharacterized protein YdgA (DUF945 family)
MKTAVKVIAGVVVTVGVLASAGAWYTGTQVEGVVRAAVAQANQQLRERMVGENGPATLEVASIERHWFSTDVRYQLLLGGSRFRDAGQPLELRFADHMEHGPLPLSRLKKLNLWPVMVASRFVLENTPATQPWFTATGGAAPLQGEASIGYGRAAEVDLRALPFVLEAGSTPLRFAGARMHLTSSADGGKIDSSGRLDALQVTLDGQTGPLTLAVKGLDFSSGGSTGASGFFLGHSDAKAEQVTTQVLGHPAVELNNVSGALLSQEVAGQLAGQASYDIGMIRYDGKDIGSSRLSAKLGNFELAASQALLEFYRAKVEPQAQAAAAAQAAGKPYDLRLSPTDQAQLSRYLAAWLAGKPHLELENWSLKTASGESQASLGLDLTDPGNFDLPPAALYQKIIANLKAQVTLSKPMVADVVTLQAQAQGLTDPAALAKQAKGTADGLAGMAQIFGLAKVEGDNIVARLHYADGLVDFNGQKMTAEQFAGLMMAKAAQLSPR